MLDTYLCLLDEGYREATFAFDGLSDDKVWKRPSDVLLSIGEIAGHVAYWEAIKFASEGSGPEGDFTKCKIKSPLINSTFRYYTSNLELSISPELKALSAAQICSELLRVHNETAAYLKKLNPDLTITVPGWPSGNSYKALLSYAIFHISYHTGQMYSARHLLGDTTADN